jgi:hypothetical protein
MNSARATLRALLWFAENPSFFSLVRTRLRSALIALTLPSELCCYNNNLDIKPIRRLVYGIETAWYEFAVVVVMLMVTSAKEAPDLKGAIFAPHYLFS